VPKSSEQKLKYQAAYNSKPENVDKRVANNQARAEAIRDGRVHKGDNRDVAHLRALDNGGSNAKSNLAVQDRSYNRAWRKGVSDYKVPNKK